MLVIYDAQKYKLNMNEVKMNYKHTSLDNVPPNLCFSWKLRM